jgi:hypothetical protein
MNYLLPIKTREKIRIVFLEHSKKKDFDKISITDIDPIW